MPEKECLYYEVKDGRLLCRLCGHRCVLADGEVGRCHVRQRRGDTLIALTYGEITAVHLDPIEKKPLYHFHPGSYVLSLGSWGCNLRCDFCQNWTISQHRVPTRPLPPEKALQLAQSAQNNIGLAYTYNEPLIWYEYLIDTGRLVKQAGLKNVVVTNGYIEEEPLRELLPLLDAVNVDIKSMSDEFYQRLCGGRAIWARRTAEICAESAHVEITNLLIPGENDSDDDIRALVDWAAEKLGPYVPLHFSRYHPDYKMTAPPTPPGTLRRAYEIAREKLAFVYLGNILLDEGQDTHCPSCGAVVVRRNGFSVSEANLQDGRCARCGAGVHVVT
jgi:pyruvate formate lyase activating enzyme